MPELHELSITEATGLLSERKLSSRELTQAIIERIAAVEPRVRAYLALTTERALAQADAADARIAAGERGPLLGVPVAIKDVLCTEGVATTCGSKMLQNFVPPYDATVVSRLFGAGAVMVGQDEHGRVRDGLVDGELRLPPDAQPVGSDARARRLVRRLGGCRRGGRSDFALGSAIATSSST